MVNVVIEHIILTSLLVVVMLTFPFTISSAIIPYVNQQRNITVQGALNRLTSTVQQLSYSLCQVNIQPGNVTLTQPLPLTINSHWYTVAAIVENDHKLTFSLYLPGLDLQINKTLTLDSHTAWKGSEYSSLVPTAALNVEKFSNGTLQFSFI